MGNSFGTIEEDVQRRDFTMNALYYDPLQEQVIDYVGGFKDIKKHLLRPVIPVEKIFVEDPVRMLRAIKYSATTNAKMSFSLKRRIRASAGLLSQVSPSRLTEEMLKILNSPHASHIISESLKSDLYIYLQPTVCSMIYENRNFERKYMESVKKLDLLNQTKPESRLGKKMVYLIQDFVESLTDWNQELKGKSSASELYAKTWTECRNFVLPMNPVRRELEYAVKTAMQNLGVNIKINEKEKAKKTAKDDDKTAPKAEKSKSKKNRKKKKSSEKKS